MSKLALLLVLPSLLWAGKVERDVDHALSIELNGSFFQDLSQHLLSYELKDIIHEPLPDEHGQNDDFKYSIMGMHFSVDFKDFDIRPIDGHLHFQVGVGDVHLHVDTLKGKFRKVGAVKATCYNVDVHIARGSTLVSTATLKPKIVDGKIDLELAELNFDIPEDQFDVEGPSKCKGIVGKVLKSKVPKLIKKQRPKLVEKVKEELQSKIPSFEDEINEKIIINEEFELGDIIFLPPTKLQVQLHPQELLLASDKMQLYYRAHFASEVPSSQVPTPLQPADKQRYGHFGVHTDIINNLFAVTFPEGEVPLVDLTDGKIPEMQEFFTSQAFIEILPDLVHFGEDRDIPLKAWMGLDGLPRVTITGDHQIAVDLPDILLKLAVPDGELWSDYHLFRIRLSPQFSIEQKDGVIAIWLAQMNELTIDGEWMEGLPYSNPQTDYPLFELTFQAILDTLLGDRPLATFNVPDIRIGDIVLDTELSLQAPYMGVILGRQ